MPFATPQNLSDTSSLADKMCVRAGGRRVWKNAGMDIKVCRYKYRRSAPVIEAAIFAIRLNPPLLQPSANRAFIVLGRKEVTDYSNTNHRRSVSNY